MHSPPFDFVGRGSGRSIRLLERGRIHSQPLPPILGLGSATGRTDVRGHAAMSTSIASVSTSAPAVRGEAMEGPRSAPDRDRDADDGAKSAARAPAPAPAGQGTKVDCYA